MIIGNGKFGILTYEVLKARGELKKRGAACTVTTSLDGSSVTMTRPYRRLSDAVAYLSCYGYYVSEKLYEVFEPWWNDGGWEGKSALVLRVGEKPEIITPKNGKDFELKELQEIVGGYIEVINADKDSIVIFDEEGVHKHRPRNMAAEVCVAVKSGAMCRLHGPVMLCHNDMVK